ncbi:MAG TPA: M1 family aminopeptidase [Vicinamibacterales bacterium]|nr:M1 family aminopeptidase [Vicinamibacterales bacterium]
MRSRLLIPLLALLAAAPAAFLVMRLRDAPVFAPAVPDAGISRTLAEDRAQRVSDLRYFVTLRVPADTDQPIPSRMVATFRLLDADEGLAFDFAQPADRLLAVSANGEGLTPRVDNGHVVIPADVLLEGHNRIEIDFHAGDEPLNRNDEFLYALFVPARASLAMPVFDQPDLKARWTLALEIPGGWTAVSNGAAEGVSRGAAADTWTFAETQPISTYLFTFAAGKFSVEEAERSGRAFRMLHRETDAGKLARNRDIVFDLHARALAWLEDYTGIPYPFGKFDFVLIPSFQFGGMEHPGSVFYNASSLLLDEAATQGQQLGRASLIAHETAHMWFGDLVTMRWFNDVWMKEVFANFMAAKIVNPSFPEVNHDLRFLYAHYPAAYEVDRTEGANPIRQALANLNDAGSLYGAIIYQKAPIVMRQLELLIGAETMREGLREYLRNHAYGNATWTDLVRVLDAKTDTDLATWSRAWVEEPGRPVIRTRLPGEDGAAPELAFETVDPRGRGLVWPQVLHVRVSRLVDVVGYDVHLGDGRTVVPEVRDAPEFVLPTGKGLGYGDFVLDARTLEYLVTSLHRIEDPLTRGAALVTLWESMLEGSVPASGVIDQLLAALPVEQNELTVNQMLAYLREGFWRHTPAAGRPALAARVEPVLRTGLARAASTSVKTAWFNTLRSVASTPETIAWLERVWRRDEKVPGVPLAESDEADLALDLAVRDVDAAEEILNTQLQRIQNPDRKARFAFVMPALAGDPAVRARFFEGLKDVSNRRREAWVLEAMRYLHHPLRAGVSARLVVPSLELVREIQRTGDIFFPKRWADATLSGYQSPAVAAEVRAFIDGLPSDYPPRLEWVLVASADPLFRAAR